MNNLTRFALSFSNFHSDSNCIFISDLDYVNAEVSCTFFPSNVKLLLWKTHAGLVPPATLNIALRIGDLLFCFVISSVD